MTLARRLLATMVGVEERGRGAHEREQKVCSTVQMMEMLYKSLLGWDLIRKC
jgi:hypothetical protein